MRGGPPYDTAKGKPRTLNGPDFLPKNTKSHWPQWWTAKHWNGVRPPSNSSTPAIPTSVISSQLRHVSAIRKKHAKQQYLLHMSPQYGELRPTSGWDRSGSLGHLCNFSTGSRLGSVAARHSSSGRQPNFVALNRGRHIYSAGRPSRWALAHISSYNYFRHVAMLQKFAGPLVGDPFLWGPLFGRMCWTCLNPPLNLFARCRPNYWWMFVVSTICEVMFQFLFYLLWGNILCFVNYFSNILVCW